MTEDKSRAAGTSEGFRQQAFRGLLIAGIVTGLGLDLYGDVDGDRWTELGSGLAVSALIGLVILELQSSLERGRFEAERREREEKAREEDRVRAAEARSRLDQEKLILQLVLVSKSDGKFEGLRLVERDLNGMFLRRLDLRKSVFDSASARDADFSGAKLAEMSARNADLHGAVFRGAALPRADLTGADLTNADFTAADLTGVIFDQADVSGATFTEAQIEPSALDLARGVDDGA